MRALEPEVVDAVWRAVEGLIPAPIDGHPLGCHRPRAPDRLCFEGILLRLVTGCAWVAASYSNPPSPLPMPATCSPSARRCISTAATTTPSSAGSWRASVSS